MAGQTYYVAVDTPNADDKNTGDCSNPFKSINAAILVAEPGDIIEVAPGTYKEAVLLDKENLTLVNSQSKCNSSVESGAYSEKLKVIAFSLGNFLTKKGRGK